jgi:hypothetical protein
VPQRQRPLGSARPRRSKLGAALTEGEGVPACPLCRLPREHAFFDGPRPLLLGKMTAQDVAMLTAGRRGRNKQVRGTGGLSHPVNASGTTGPS